MHRSIVRKLVAATALTVIAACGDRSIAGPAEIQGSASSRTTAGSTVNLPLITRLQPLSRDYSTSATVGVLGGVLTIPNAGLVVIIPLGALTKSTKITVTAHAGSLISYSFAPHGLTFKQPISVLQLASLTNVLNNPLLISRVYGGYLPNDQADINAAGVGAFSEVFRTSLVPAGLMVGPAILFRTNHFSGYAYASGRSPAECEQWQGSDGDEVPGECRAQSNDIMM
jgi:hypothetical protein